MSKFFHRAFNKIEKLSIEEIKTLVRYQASENELLSRTLQALEVGILVTNTNGRVLVCNESLKRLLPLGRKLTEGTTLRYVLADADVEEFFETATATLMQTGDMHREFHFQHGEVVRSIEIVASWFESHLEPVFSKDDKQRLLYIVRDVSENKRQEARLHRSESLASLTTVAAGVAHEIKNPLASIGIHLQLMRKAFERKHSLTLKDAARYLDIIDEEIERLNGIVVDFLFAVRPMDVRLRFESLNKIIEDLFAFITPELTQQDISVTMELEEYLPKLRMDENLLKQALLNIIKNAMSAMEGRKGELTVSTKNEGDTVDLTISDTGKGMDEATMSKMFEPYFTTKASGSGLGLTMVFKVVKEHQGEILVNSVAGKGASFSIKFPVPTTQRRALEAFGDR